MIACWIRKLRFGYAEYLNRSVAASIFASLNHTNTIMMNTHKTRLLFLAVLLFAFGVTGRAQTYCKPKVLYPVNVCGGFAYGRIESISISGQNGSELNDEVPCNADQYDRTSVIAPLNVAAGGTYYGVVRINDAKTPFNVWIDFNNDGIFDDGERLHASDPGVPTLVKVAPIGSLSKDISYAFNIAVPVDAPQGIHRMRVRSFQQWRSTTTTRLLDPCSATINSTPVDSVYYGNAADYLVNVTGSACGPVITGEPDHVSSCPGNNIGYSVTASGATGYRWQVRAGTGNFTDITDNAKYSGSSSATLSVSGIDDNMNGYEYRCVVTNGSCNTNSKRAILWVQSTTISAQPANQTIANGGAGSVSFSFRLYSVPGQNYTPKLQWQVNTGNGFVDVAEDSIYGVPRGVSLSMQNVTPAMNNNVYRCVITSFGGCVTITNTCTLTVANTPVPQYAYQNGTIGATAVPFASNAPTSNRHQALYTPGDFGNAPAGLINRIYVRASSAATAPTTFSNLTVSIGRSTQINPAGWQSGLTLARHDSTYTFNPALATEWIPLELETPVMYLPTQSLTIEITQSGKLSSNAGIFTRTGNTHVNPAYTGVKSISGALGVGTFTNVSTLQHMGLDITPCLAITNKPGDITAGTDLNGCEASNLSLGEPVATSSCGTVSISNNAPAVFPKGSTIVTWTVTDGYITETFTQTVTVIDNTNPTFTSCPSHITVSATPGECSVAVNYTIPTATDNCGSCLGTVPASIAGYTLLGTFGGHTYFVSNIPGYWEDFNTYAQSIGGYLATVSSAAENAFLSGSVGGETWCGLNDKATEGTFVWSNGEPVTFTGWCATEPNNAGDEDYTLIKWSGDECWNDGAANRQAPAIIEFDCLPGTGLNITRTAGPASGGAFPVGTTAVTYTATDASGNSSACSFNVTVLPATSANIQVTPNGTVNTGGVPTNIYLGYGPQTASMTANVSGGSNYSYSWSPTTNITGANNQTAVFAPTAPGTYTYTVTATNNGGCSYTATVTFCVTDVRVPGAGSKVYICHNGHTNAVSTAAVSAHINNHSGDQLGKCGQSCNSANKNAGEDEENIEDLVEVSADAIKVYPNPSNGSFTVELPQGKDNAEVSMSDVTGKVIEVKTGVMHVARFEQSSLAKGVYMITVRTGDETYHTKIVLQ